MSLKISRKLFWSYSNEKWQNISEHFDLKTRKTGKRSCMVYCRFVYVLLIDIFRLLRWGKRSPEKDKNEYIWWDEILWFFFSIVFTKVIILCVLCDGKMRTLNCLLFGLWAGDCVGFPPVAVMCFLIYSQYEFLELCHDDSGEVWTANCMHAWFVKS